MRVRDSLAILACGSLLLAAGCGKSKTTANINTGPFVTALNTYFQTHPSCAFPQAVKFPMDISKGGKQPDPADAGRLSALAHAGLVRKDKKKVWVSENAGGHHIRVHETVTEYALTDAGKKAVTQQGSADNFCYATPHAVAIDHYGQESSPNRYGVSFDYTIGNLPSWANDPKVQAAFPTIAAAASTQKLSGLATLRKKSSGWVASGVEPLTAAPVKSGGNAPAAQQNAS